MLTKTQICRHLIKQSQTSRMLCNRSKVQFELLYNRQTGMPLPFSPLEVQELRRSFNQLARGQVFLDRQTFRDNMGVLGLQTAEMLSDRVFCSFDMDGDGVINFLDFAEYIDILRYGNPMEKALISFRMIDIKRQGFFTERDFKDFMIEFLRSWSSITNAPITNDVLNRTNNYIKKTFERTFTLNEARVVDFNYYFKNIYKDNQLILAFDWITKGVSTQFFKSQTQNEVRLERQIVRIADQLDNIYGEIYPLVTQQSERILTTGGFPILINSPNSQQLAQLQGIQANARGITVMQRFRQLVEQIGGVKRHIQTEYMKNLNSQQEIKRRAQTSANVHKHLANKQGKMLFIGDANWNLILNMMIGLQMAVRSVKSYEDMLTEEPMDFGLKYYFELVPRRFGGDKYRNEIQICKFTDYAPNAFNHIRKIFNIDNDQYIRSIGPDKVLTSLLVGQVSSMTELLSQGKSGSFFYYTADGQYMLKTISRGEFLFIRSILFDYYYHLLKNPRSFLTKFFGLHKLVERGPNGQNIRSHYFVIMSNVFSTQQKIVQRFDLKGSFLGRVTSDPDPNATKKDVNFLHRKPFVINPVEREQMMVILQQDLNFLCKLRIVDYSMLIGVILKGTNSVPEVNLQIGAAPRIYDSVVTNQRYVMGIIDFLTTYGFRKKLQYCFKSCIYGSSVSIVPPVPYAQRMFEFVTERVFR